MAPHPHPHPRPFSAPLLLTFPSTQPSSTAAAVAAHTAQLAHSIGSAHTSTFAHTNLFALPSTTVSISPSITTSDATDPLTNSVDAFDFADDDDNDHPNIGRPSPFPSFKIPYTTPFATPNTPLTPGSPFPDSSLNSTNHLLPARTIIGIVVGSIVGAIVLGFLIFLFAYIFRAKLQAKRDARANAMGAAANVVRAAAIASNSSFFNSPIPEGGGPPDEPVAGLAPSPVPRQLTIRPGGVVVDRNKPLPGRPSVVDVYMGRLEFILSRNLFGERKDTE